METKRESRSARGIRFSISHDGREIARAYLSVMTNDPFRSVSGDCLRVARFSVVDLAHLTRPALFQMLIGYEVRPLAGQVSGA